MAKNYYKVRKDTNHAAIVNLFRSYGATVIDCAPLKNAFDLLVIFKGQTHIVEVKSGKGKLSEGEIYCKESVEKQGVRYNVIRDFDEALRLLENK